MYTSLTFRLGIILLLLTSSLVGYSQDYSQWHLPNGAKNRLGKGEINDIKFSPDGTQLAVGTSIGIWIYDVQTRKEISFLKSERYTIDAIAYQNNGSTMISASELGPILTWEGVSQTTSTKTTIPNIVNPSVRIGFAMGPTISTKGDLLANGSMSGSITLWDLQSKQQFARIKAHSKLSVASAFSYDGSTLVSGGEDGKIHLWDVNTQKRQQTLTESSQSHAIAMSQDGKKVANGNFGGGLYLWDIDTKQKLLTFKGHTDAIRAISFSPDGKLLASGGWDTSIRLWDTNTGNQIGIIYGHPHFVEEMALAPDGISAAGTSRGTISLWDTNTRRERPSQIKRSYGLIKGLTFTKDSMQLSSADVGFALKVMDVATNRELFTKTFEKHEGGYWGIAFSHDRTLIANANTDKKIRIWNIATGDQLLVIRSKFKKAIIDLTFSDNGKMIAAAGEDQSIKIWDTTAGKELCILNGHTKRIESLAFSPDGKMLASGSWDGTMRLWDIETKSQISQHGGTMGGIIAVCWSLDGRTVVSTSQSNHIQLWNAHENRKLPPIILKGHNGWIRNLAFSADGKTLASGSDDGTILLWDWEKYTESIATN